MRHIITVTALCALLSSCVTVKDTDYAYPRDTTPTRPVLPRYYPYYDPEADNPPYPNRNEPARRPASDYYRYKYPHYDPDADNPPYQGDPNAPRDGFVRPLFDE